MKCIKLFLIAGLITTFPLKILGNTFKSCKVAENTSLRLFGSILIEKDSLAHNYDEETLSLEMVLGDEPIFFTSPTGMSSKDRMIYQWFYNKPQPTNSSLTEFAADSFGEIVHIKIMNEKKTTTISYTGEQSGNYLTLNCEKF